MPDPVLPPSDDFARRLADLERIVRGLVGGQPLDSSASRGTLTFYDPDDPLRRPLAIFGRLPDGQYGSEFRTVGGRTVSKTTSTEGQVFPRVEIVPMVSVYANRSDSTEPFRPGTANATFTELWRADFDVVGPHVYFDVYVLPYGGSMEWRIICYEYGMQFSTIVVGPFTETVDRQVGGAFVIPPEALLSGGAPEGEHVTVRLEARQITAGSRLTSDVHMLEPFVNFNLSA